jgi:hypothetical protein
MLLVQPFEPQRERRSSVGRGIYREVQPGRLPGLDDLILATPITLAATGIIGETRWLSLDNQ